MNECGAIYVNMMNRQDVCDRPDTHTGPHRHGMNPNQEENPSPRRLAWDSPAPADLF